MPRTARKISQLGIYYVFANGDFGKRLTRNNEDKIELTNTIFDVREKIEFELYAFTVTNNELHMVVREFEPLQISQIMKNIFIAYSAFYNAKYDMSGSILHDRFKSIPLEDDESVRTHVRYVHQAPVKLLEHKDVFSYKFSSYNEYFSDFPKVDIEPVLNRFDAKTAMARTKFKIYHAGVELKELKGDQRYFLSDTELQDVLRSIANVDIDTYNALPRAQKYEIAKTIKKKSKLSFRQMEKLLGISRSTLAKL